MKTGLFAAKGFSSMLLVMGLFSPIKSHADVDVRVIVPLPGLVIPAPPAMIVIPGTYVYYPPDVAADIFFYHGHWYRPSQGRWHRAVSYNGPWGSIAFEKVPRVLHKVPPHFRRAAVHERVPYSDVQRHWRTWERDRHWDRHEGRRDYREQRGRGEHNGSSHERGKNGKRSGKQVRA